MCVARSSIRFDDSLAEIYQEAKRRKTSTALIPPRAKERGGSYSKPSATSPLRTRGEQGFSLCIQTYWGLKPGFRRWCYLNPGLNPRVGGSIPSPGSIKTLTATTIPQATLPAAVVFNKMHSVPNHCIQRSGSGVRQFTADYEITRNHKDVRKASNQNNQKIRGYFRFPLRLLNIVGPLPAYWGADVFRKIGRTSHP